MILNEEKDLRVALLMKSDDELKAIINESGIYGKELVCAAREELTARVAGKSRQKTQEEILKEEEEQRRIEEERLQREKEEALRKQEAAKAEMARRKALARKQAKRAGIILSGVLIVGAIVGFFVWNNTDERLVERGQKALAAGNEEKATKLFERAEDTNAEAAYELWKLKKTNYYLEKAADLGHDEACAQYAVYLLREGAGSRAIHYFSKISDLLTGEGQYLLGCAYYMQKNWDAAREAFEVAVNKGNTKANVSLGDWYLCQGELNDYLKALEYYEAAPDDWPGIQEKRQVLRDLKKRDHNFETDRWKGAQFWGEGQTAWNNWQSHTRSVRRGIYKNIESKHRSIGKFDTTGKLLGGLGIETYSDGQIYVGNIKIKPLKDGYYTTEYSGKGYYTNANGTVKSGQRKNGRLTGTYTETNIFGETKTVNQ